MSLFLANELFHLCHAACDYQGCHMAGSRFFSPGGWYFLEKQIRHGNPGKEPNPNVWAGVILYLQIAAFSDIISVFPLCWHVTMNVDTTPNLSTLRVKSATVSIFKVTYKYYYFKFVDYFIYPNKLTSINIIKYLNT